MTQKNAPLETLKKPHSVLLIDYNKIDLFVNQKLLENYGIENICCMGGASDALMHLRYHKIYYPLIIIDIYLPFSNGFEFIDKVRELELYKEQGEIVIITNSVDPADREQAKRRNIRFIEKPLKVEKLFAEIETSKNTHQTK